MSMIAVTKRSPYLLGRTLPAIARSPIRLPLAGQFVPDREPRSPALVLKANHEGKRTMSDTNRTDPLSSTGRKDTEVEFTPSSSTANGAAVSFEPAGSDESVFETTDVPEQEGDTASAKAKGAARTLKDEASKLGQQATEKARGLADEGKLRATGALDEFSKMMEDAATTVDEKLGEQYGQYARSAAQTLSGFSDSLRGKEVDELIDDVRGFVRKSPAVAIGTAAALGFVLARVVKAGVDGAADATDTTPTA
jgi:ElaB/YqjD/DUF883 family membrane-anchored ribosome-binding protein